MNEIKTANRPSQSALAHARTKKMVLLAMLAAVAYVVMYLSKLIPVNVMGFLNFDLKDVVIGIAGFIFGPLAAAGLSIVVSLIEMFTVSSTGYWGLLMNILSTCAFVCPAALIYQKHRSLKGAVIGLVSGALLMTAVMLLWNYLITPIYTGMAREAIADLLIPIFLPFNLIKAGINGALMMLIYKPVVNALRKAKLVEASRNGEAAAASSSGKRVGLALVFAVVLATFVLLALVLAGVI